MEINLDDSFIKAQIEESFKAYEKYPFLKDYIRGQKLLRGARLISSKELIEVRSDSPKWVREGILLQRPAYKGRLSPKTLLKIGATLDYIIRQNNDFEKAEKELKKEMAEKIKKSPESEDSIKSSYAKKLRKVKARDITFMLGKYPFEYFLKKADEEVKRIKEKTKILEVKTAEEVVYNFKNGFYVVRLVKQAAFNREGSTKRMNNCVAGRSFYTSTKKRSTFSLRGPNDEPHLTFEISMKTFRVIEYKGKCNKKPIAKYHQMLMHFLRVTRNTRDLPPIKFINDSPAATNKEAEAELNSSKKELEKISTTEKIQNVKQFEGYADISLEDAPSDTTIVEGDRLCLTNYPLRSPGFSIKADEIIIAGGAIEAFPEFDGRPALVAELIDLSNSHVKRLPESIEFEFLIWDNMDSSIRHASIPLNKTIIQEVSLEDCQNLEKVTFVIRGDDEYKIGKLNLSGSGVTDVSFVDADGKDIVEPKVSISVTRLPSAGSDLKILRNHTRKTLTPWGR